MIGISGDQMLLQDDLDPTPKLIYIWRNMLNDLHFVDS